MSTALVRFERARRALEEARTIDEVKDVRDKAEALRLYMKQSGESLEMQNAAAEIKLRAERRAGELLDTMKENGQRAGQGGDRKSKTHDECLIPPALDDLGIDDNQATRWHTLASVPEERFEQHIAGVKAEGSELTTAGMLRLAQWLRHGLADHQLINQSTNNEWYTPPQYIEAVHEVMGGIDLDPASCTAANKIVRARKFYTVDDDGFIKPWRGRVFLNPPYGREDGEGSNQARWSARLVEQYHAGLTTEAILLVNAVPSNRWFAPLWDFPICFTNHRIRFYDGNGEFGQPTHSNCFVYLGPQVDRFASIFSRFGVVAVRYQVRQEVAEVTLETA